MIRFLFFLLLAVTACSTPPQTDLEISHLYQCWKASPATQQSMNGMVYQPCHVGSSPGSGMDSYTFSRDGKVMMHSSDVNAAQSMSFAGKWEVQDSLLTLAFPEMQDFSFKILKLEQENLTLEFNLRNPNDRGKNM